MGNTQKPPPTFFLIALTLELCVVEKSIASLCSDSRSSNTPHNEVNRWDCVATAIIWMVWFERNQRIFQAKSYAIIELYV